MSSVPTLPDPRQAVRMLIAGTLIVVVAMGIRATFGLFMQPLGVAHGWGRDVFSMAFAIQNLVWGLFGIVMGTIADRYGAGRAIVISVLAYILGLIGLRFATTEMELYLTAGLLIGIGQAGTTFAVILPVVARSFSPASRSTAMGIASAGGSLGQFLVVPSGQFLIGQFDWVGALWALSLLMAVGLPLAWSLRGKPAADAGGRELSLGAAVRGAITDRSYQFLFASYAVCGFHTAFVTLHLPAYAQDSGLTAANGAFALALVGLFNTFGSFWSGKLGGIYSKKHLLAGVYWARGLGILFLMSVPLTPTTLYVFAAWMGVFWLGTVPLTQGLIGDIFGLRYAATLSGVVFLGHQIGSFLGVWLGGQLYVATGSYDVVWWLSVALALIAGALCLPVKPEPRGQPAVSGAAS
ncbi:MFS transporter [Achromobacter sp. GG226]|uniref:MFS transporter n=1 Tax=Verticiella alkaliphila TaxID=2779529 RepID=UPI001C0C2F7E|nr:MFS transporter [Verticiella sp. GG226]MBU4612684.1 MFS transporter [Verticiella sp. GG226]